MKIYKNDVLILLNISITTLDQWELEGKIMYYEEWNNEKQYNSFDIVKILKYNQKQEKSFKFIDLFSWVWGFHLVFNNLWGECVSAVEFDKNCRITYELNFYNESKEMFDSWCFFEDIRTVNEKKIPNHNILCGWFPCQAFSIAWFQKGFEDDRGNLFFDIERIIKEKKPEVIFLENVKNLTTHDKWKTFWTIIDRLEKQWYFIKHKVLNSCEYWDIPQNRERIYIVWFRDRQAYDKFEFPKPIKLTKKIWDIFEKWNIDKCFYYNNKPMFSILEKEIKNSDTVYQWRRQYVRENKKNLVPTLTANMWTWGHNVPLVLTKDWIRKLTPRECFNAQGFPKSFKLPKISNSQLYKQAGNSVSVPVLQRIWENILLALWKPKNNKNVLISENILEKQLELSF